MIHRSPFVVLRSTCVVLGAAFGVLGPAFAADAIPRLTQPVNDFAHVIDSASASEMDRMIRALQTASFRCCARLRARAAIVASSEAAAPGS